MSNLAKASVSAVKWSTLTTIGRFSLQLIAQVVLARMLGPDVYGVFGMGLVIYTFSYFVAMFGFAWSLGQLKEISETDVRFAFTWQMTVASCAAVGLYFSADLAGHYFQDTRVIPIVRWMSVVCVLTGFSAVSGYLMNRELNFKVPGIVQFFSYAIGYLGVGIPLAYAGWGVNALLAAWLTQAFVSSIATFCCRPHSIRPRWTSPQGRVITRIGATAFMTNLVNWGCNNVDRAFIGRTLDASSMGLYNAGYNLANMPNSLLVSALQPVFLRVGSKVQGQAGQQAKAFGEVLGIIWVLLLPVFFSLSLSAPYLIQMFYGDKWTDAGPVLSVLFLGMPAYVMWGMSTPVLWNMGKARYEMLLQLPLLPVAALAYYLFSRYGVFYAAMITSGLLLMRGILVGGIAGRIVGLKIRFILAQMMRGVVFCALIYASQRALEVTSTAHFSPLFALIAATILHATVCLGCALTFPRLLGPQAANLIVRFVPALRQRLIPSH